MKKDKRIVNRLDHFDKAVEKAEANKYNEHIASVIINKAKKDKLELAFMHSEVKIMLELGWVGKQKDIMSRPNTSFNAAEALKDRFHKQMADADDVIGAQSA